MARNGLPRMDPAPGQDWTSLPQYRTYAKELHDRPVPCCPRCGANPRRGFRMLVGMNYVVCCTCQKMFNR